MRTNGLLNYIYMVVNGFKGRCSGRDGTVHRNEASKQDLDIYPCICGLVGLLGMGWDGLNMNMNMN